jgi:hypothetical protein
MKRAIKTDLVWLSVDLESLPADLQRKFSAHRKAADEAQNAKRAFEAAFIAAARKGKKVGASESFAFGYRFGKLAIAVVEDKPEAAPKAAKAGFSL